MEYSKLVEVQEKLEKTSSYLDKVELISRLLAETPKEEIRKVVLLLLGEIFPPYESKEIGIGPQLIKEAIARATGYSRREVDELMLSKGDLGEVAEELVKKKRQVTLFRESLSVEKVYSVLRKVSEISGEGSQEKKILWISELLTNSSPLEAKYIVRTVLGELRLGIAEGRLRDSISKAFHVSPELVERAYMFTGDYSLVAERAALGGEAELKNIRIEVGRPVSPMLAQRADSIDEVIRRLGKAAFEIKLDGIRIQIHKKKDRIWIFTRKLENYTSMFPDLVKDSLDSIKPDKAIIDGELVAINPETGKPMPFQEVLRRRRKYNIEEVSRELPIQFHAFDVLYSEGVEKIDLPYEERRKTLEEIIEQKEGKFHVVERIISDDEKEIKDFLNYSLSLGHEGLLAKDLNSPYRVGKREFLWLKVKPGGDTLDLVVVGAFYGKGKRAGVFGSYLLAARDEESDKLLTVSKLGSGFTDDELKELTEKFKSLVMKRKPGILEAEIEPHVWIEPKIVFEVMFEEIQKSPEEKHTSGFGLRFPRFVRIREDKGVEEISTIQEIEEMYRKQEEKKGGVSPLSSSS